ncbi:hypothetical protein HN51_070758 [Arachis hypogaea]
MRARSERRGDRQRESSFRSRGEENFHSGKEALMPMSNMVTAQSGDARKLTGGYSPLEMGEKNGDGYLAIEDVIGCEAKVRSKQELFAEASH